MYSFRRMMPARLKHQCLRSYSLLRKLQFSKKKDICTNNTYEILYENPKIHLPKRVDFLVFSFP